MIGIDGDILDKIIKINNVNSETLVDNNNRVLDTISSLKECYSGYDLNFVFSEVIEQQKELKKIINIINNYSVVLSNVKISYTNQDSNISNIVNHNNSQFN